MGDEFEQDVGLLFGLFDVAEVVQDQCAVALELVQGVLQAQLLAGEL